jgi:hypothetical protein
MQSRTLILGLGMMLLLAVPLSLVACSSPGSSPTPAGSPTPSVSPTPGVGDAPSKAHVVAAVKRLIKQRHVPRPWAISVRGVEQDAGGRWRASAWLRQEPTSSYLGDVMVIVKDPGAWRFVTLKPLQPGGPRPTLPQALSPDATPQSM